MPGAPGRAYLGASDPTAGGPAVGTDLLAGNLAPLVSRRGMIVTHDVAALRFPESYSRGYVAYSVACSRSSPVACAR